MTDTNKLFELGQLAEASYGDFTKSTVQGKLATDINGNPLFSGSQIDEFIKHWHVISHQPDTPNGFSATLFQRLDTDASYQAGQYVYAIRGTAGTVDLIGADGGDIVLDGLARVGRNSVAYYAECFVTNIRRNTAIAYCALRVTGCLLMQPLRLIIQFKMDYLVTA